MSAPPPPEKAPAGRLSILVGAPDPGLRARLLLVLRQQGHRVLEASNAADMRARLAETAGTPLDAILCGGLFTDQEDPGLAEQLASPEVSHALILIPSGGYLSTATRAERLAADAVLSDPLDPLALEEILRLATKEAGRLATQKPDRTSDRRY